MRILAKCLLVAVMAVPAAFAQSAPSAPTTPACDGQMVNIRVSTISPGGSMDKFMAAVEAQKAWYKSHGLGDIIFASKIVDRPSSAYSTTEALSYHFYPAGEMKNPPHDAGWDTFVKLFADTSMVKVSYLTCVPKAMVPMPGM